jgi:hypothetical protein
MSEGGWDLVEAVSQAFRLPPPGCNVCECEGLHPRRDLTGELDEDDPDLVLIEAVQGEVT